MGSMYIEKQNNEKQKQKKKKNKKDHIVNCHEIDK